MAIPAPQLMRAPGTSLHRQIYLVLRDGILNKTWPSGTALPTEEALGAQFDVSRVTVRRALADLAASGLVERRHGVGTYVNGDGTADRPGASLGMVEELRLSHSEAQVQVIEVAAQVPPPDVARMLQVPPGGKAVHALRLRHVGGTPVMLTDAWVPERFSRKVTASSLKKRALYEILMANGVEFGRVVQQVSAEAAPPQRARLLQTEVGAPLIKVIRLLHDRQAQPVQYIVVYASPERTRMLMDIPGEAMNTLSAGQFVHDGVPQSKPAGKSRK